MKRKQKSRAAILADLDTLQWRALKRPLSDSKQPGLAKERGTIRDDYGRQSQPHRIHDTLAALARVNRISLAQQRAGQRFEELCDAVQLDTLQAADLERIGGGNPANSALPSFSAAFAQDQIMIALAALGGAQTANGRVAWLVLGEGKTLRETAELQADLPNGKEGERAAKWLLIGALDILAVHFGYAEPQKILDRAPRPTP